MKKLLLAVTLLSSFTAFGMVMEDGDLSCNDNPTAYHQSTFADAFTITSNCAISTTISLPTLLIEGQEMDLQTEEASMRLVAEANGDLNPELLAVIANETNVEIDTVADVVLELDHFGQATVINVMSELSQN